jgi:hypothetical protein
VIATVTIAWCARREHPWVTFNPWLDRTWCRCGARQAEGAQSIDLDAVHAIHHVCAPGSATCRCYVDNLELTL